MLPEIKAAGLRGQTTVRDNSLPELWSRFMGIVEQVPNRTAGGRGFGICEACQEGNTIYRMTDEVRFSEVVSVEVDSFEGLSAPFVPKVIEGGRYAVFTHKGSLDSLIETFRYIWGTWMLNTKEELDSRQDFECYDGRFFGVLESGVEDGYLYPHFVKRDSCFYILSTFLSLCHLFIFTIHSFL